MEGCFLKTHLLNHIVPRRSQALKISLQRSPTGPPAFAPWFHAKILAKFSLRRRRKCFWNSNLHLKNQVRAWLNSNKSFELTLVESEGDSMVVVGSRCRSKSFYRDFVRVGGNIRDMAFDIFFNISAGYESGL